MRPQSRNILVFLTTGTLGILAVLSLFCTTVLLAHPRLEISKMLTKESVSPDDFTKYHPTNSEPEPIVQDVGSTISVTVTVTNLTTSLVPDRFSISQNYPNPFNSTTIIEYDLPIPTHVSIEVYNILGQMVQTLVNDHKPAGFHRAEWDGKTVNGRIATSGVYLYRIQATGFVKTKKMLICL